MKIHNGFKSSTAIEGTSSVTSLHIFLLDLHSPVFRLKGVPVSQVLKLPSLLGD